MPNTYFQFKQFTVHQDRCAMKVTTDACLFGAWTANEIASKKETFRNCLDIGTGTGLLSLMIAQKNNLKIDTLEIDINAAEQAKENVFASARQEQINVICGDLLTWQTNSKYDCIVSNPPFYEGELKSTAKSKNIAHHDEGLKLSWLMSFIKKHLTDEGIFFLLLPAKRSSELDFLMETAGLFMRQKMLVKQTPKHPHFRVMIQGGKMKMKEPSETFISIKDERDKYPAEFVTLLKDYYLFL